MVLSFVAEGQGGCKELPFGAEGVEPLGEDGVGAEGPCDEGEPGAPGPPAPPPGPPFPPGPAKARPVRLVNIKKINNICLAILILIL